MCVCVYIYIYVRDRGGRQTPYNILAHTTIVRLNFTNQLALMQVLYVWEDCFVSAFFFCEYVLHLQPFLRLPSFIPKKTIS